MYSPYIFAETPSYAALYKPPRMHSVPLKRDPASVHRRTLLDWYAGIFPEVREVKGRNPWEGGIVHRLDYETRGLVLAAKTQAFFNHILIQQEKGLFVKGYRSVTTKTVEAAGGIPACVESAFRSYGPSGGMVKPILKPFPKNKEVCLDQGRYYCTRIVDAIEREDGTVCFRLQLKRGFRHQIRCHLAWIGFPIVHDMLYGAAYYRQGDLALSAEALTFLDVDGTRVHYTMDSIVFL
ncbi:MAG: RNA pseudouridine synthase [Treponema sp.]|jgi:23S rRNA pseudouridine1911/1915/1917 synthase|nr:RNA pseudouridine synthase [Treponema sp.]